MFDLPQALLLARIQFAFTATCAANSTLEFVALSLLTPLADMPPFSQSDRLTRVCRAHVLAALTKPPAHRLRRLRPPPPSPAPCQARGVRARRSHKPAWALFRYW